MLELNENLRNQIVNYLKSCIVPSEVGANLTMIARELENLKPVEKLKDNKTK